MSQAADYSVQKQVVDGIETVQLIDSKSKAEVGVVPSIGNTAYSFRVGGEPVFWSPYKSLTEFQAKPTFLGNPFLAPWANRLDAESFYANGRKFNLNSGLGNLRYDPNKQPIHGLISYAKEWKVIDTGADDRSAWVTSRLEFWRKPEWMAQFPFAHAIEMTYRLSGGALEVRTRIENLADEAMPLVVGYHPYFAIPQRDEWRIHLAAKEHVVLSPKLTPTGERKPVTFADPLPLRGVQLDDVFTGLASGAEFWVEKGSRRITVVYGAKYTVAVVYAPPGREFICFEPMTGITNGANLAHEGKYAELQSIPSRGVWEESFWIRTAGY